MWRCLRLPALLAYAVALLAYAQTELISYENFSTFSSGGKLQAMAYNYEGDLLAVGGDSGNVTLYSVSQQAVKTTMSAGGRVTALTFSRDNKYLAAAAGPRVIVWDLASNQARSFNHGGTVLAVAFGPGNDLLASGGTDKDVVLWSLNLGQEVGRLRGAHSKDIRFLSFQGRGETLVSVGADRNICFWDSKARTKLKQMQEPDPSISSFSSSPRGEWLILGTENTYRIGEGARMGVARGLGLQYEDRVKIYDTQTGIQQKQIPNLIAEPVSVSLSADYKYIAAAMRDIKITYLALWDVERAMKVVDIPVTGRVTRVAFSPNGKWLSYGDESGKVNVLKMAGIYPRLAYTGDLRGRKYIVTSPRAPLVKPSGRIRFALLELDPIGVEPDIARAVTEQLNNRLAVNPAVKLVERRRVSALLKEQEFQHSGRTDPMAAVQLAKIFNVQKVLLGSVNKLGSTMTINAQLVDVETAEINGVREVQCKNCALEDLSDAMQELSETLVASPDAALPPAPDPPKIRIESPTEGEEVAASNLTLRGKIEYSIALEGVELIVNGQPFAASRTFTAPEGKTTKLPSGGSDFRFVQSVPLEPGNNVIAVRAIGGDGNDDQKYVFVRRLSASAPPAVKAVPPPLSVAEVDDALRNQVSKTRLTVLVRQYGVDFSVTIQVEKRLRSIGGDDALLAAIAHAKR
jgi:hypothetical protein